MEHSNKLVLAYWSVRGRAQALRYFLEYLGLPYEEKRYDIPKFQEWFMEDKPKLTADFPNLPYLKNGEKYVTETEAIYHYLCLKNGREDLLGKTVDDKIDVTTTRWVLHDIIISVGETAYNPEFEKIRDPTFEKKVIPKLTSLSKFLGTKEYLHGYLTYVDFIFYELLDLISAMKRETLDPFENLKEFHRKFAEQKFMKDYITSEKYIRRPFFGPATWNPME